MKAPYGDIKEMMMHFASSAQTNVHRKLVIQKTIITIS